jgi:hypothetical protein
LAVDTELVVLLPVALLAVTAVQAVAVILEILLLELRLGELRHLGKETQVAQQFQAATPVGQQAAAVEQVARVVTDQTGTQVMFHLLVLSAALVYHLQLLVNL